MLPTLMVPEKKEVSLICHGLRTRAYTLIVVSLAGLDGYNQWPKHDPKFHSTLMEYFDTLQALCLQLLQAVSQSLGLDAQYLQQNYLQECSSFIRLNHYPPCSDEDLRKNTLGVGPHSGNEEYLPSLIR